MSRCRPIAQTAERGLTLLELIITLSLLAAFLGAVNESVVTGLRATHAASRREQIRQQLVSALERLARDAAIADDVDDADDDDFQFDTPSADNVGYSYDGSADTLERENVVIVRNLTAFDFSYTGCTGTAYASGTADNNTEDTLRVVQITATVTLGSESIATASSMFLPNMRGQQSGTCGSS